MQKKTTTRPTLPKNQKLTGKHGVAARWFRILRKEKIIDRSPDASKPFTSLSIGIYLNVNWYYRR